MWFRVTFKKTPRSPMIIGSRDIEADNADAALEFVSGLKNAHGLCIAGVKQIAPPGGGVMTAEPPPLPNGDGDGDDEEEDMKRADWWKNR